MAVGKVWQSRAGTNGGTLVSRGIQTWKLTCGRREGVMPESHVMLGLFGTLCRQSQSGTAISSGINGNKKPSERPPAWQPLR